ncbi:MAG: hypothetical protein AABZ55_14995 [Bdellovibrionota bacterium]
MTTPATTPTSGLLPVFCKAHLTFTIDGKKLEFAQQNTSVFGVTGLAWEPLSSRDHFGKTVELTLTVPSDSTPVSFKTQAVILREVTGIAKSMGLRFKMQAEGKKQLEAVIAKAGFHPTSYLRKHPRIPSTLNIQTFPLRVVGIPDSLQKTSEGQPVFPIVFDVGNISPSGILLSTENQLALSIHPGEQMDLVIEPRGWFPVQIATRGLVCRTIDDINDSNGNLLRYFGIKIIKLDEVNRNAFLDLLKDILGQMKTHSDDIR